jgi:Carbohydrate esterase, sialic acid-specific acetylesterase
VSGAGRAGLAAVCAMSIGCGSAEVGGVRSGAATDAKLVFLLVGQSNMAGRGQVEDADRVAHPRVWALDREDRWVPAVDPIHFDRPAVAGVGPGTSFGRAVADAMPDVIVGLVPCAVGGSSIDDWSSEVRDGLHAEAVRRARIALEGGTLAGILWHQGESDVAAPDHYAEKAARLFADLRRDLAAPGAPVIVGTLGDFLAGAEALNRVLRSLPESVPRCACAGAEGLGHGGDRVHFDAASARVLGRRYARKWLDLARPLPGQ